MEIQLHCSLCGSTGKLFRVLPEDKYQGLIGIKSDRRKWITCPACGLYWQVNGLTDDDLYRIYKKYRDSGFRDTPLKELFHKVNNLDAGESENHYRWDWFNRHIHPTEQTLLDIGSGFGIWPYKVRQHGWNVSCVEPNDESAEFINQELKIPCSCDFSNGCSDSRFPVISIVHVLEHIRHPIGFLENIRNSLKDGGKLFIEVPDSVEFGYLDPEHDEFNSCHFWFFSVGALSKLVGMAGFSVTDIHRVWHHSRNLSRILMICQNI